MSHPLRTFRAFSMELMKHAAKIQDADIQKLLAERNGEEYLDGGRLLTNTAAEAEYAPKLAHNFIGAASGNYDVLKSHKKRHNAYQSVRDYLGTGLKGGLTGLGILGATNAMKGRFGAPVGAAATQKAMKAARSAFAGGASIAMADRAYRYSEKKDESEKTAFAVSPGLNTTFKSPAAELAQSRQVGSFKSVVHDTGTAPKSVQIGRKFRIP